MTPTAPVASNQIRHDPCAFADTVLKENEKGSRGFSVRTNGMLPHVPSNVRPIDRFSSARTTG